MAHTETTSERLEAARQQYLTELSEIITEERLDSVMATQLCFSEIASWLMTISTQLQKETPVRICPECSNMFSRDY